MASLEEEVRRINESATDASAQLLFDFHRVKRKFGQRTTTLLGLFQPQVGKLVATTEATVGRTAPAIASLGRPPWQLDLEQLIDAFGPATMLSYDFLSNLRDLGAGAACSWQDALHALQLARRARQRNHSMHPGASASQDWCPMDVKRAAEALNVQGGKLAKRRTKKPKESLHPHKRRKTDAARLEPQSSPEVGRGVSSAELDDGVGDFVATNDDDGDGGDSDADMSPSTSSVRRTPVPTQSVEEMPVNPPSPCAFDPEETTSGPLQTTAAPLETTSVPLHEKTSEEATAEETAAKETSAKETTLVPLQTGSEPSKDMTLNPVAPISADVSQGLIQHVDNAKAPHQLPPTAWRGHETISSVLEALVPREVCVVEVCPAPDNAAAWQSWTATSKTRYSLQPHHRTVWILLHQITRAHWARLSLGLRKRHATVYDSIATKQDAMQPAAEAIVGAFGFDWAKEGWELIRHPEAIQQQNTHDCGLLMLVTCSYNIAGTTLPKSVDTQLWRTLLCTALEAKHLDSTALEHSLISRQDDAPRRAATPFETLIPTHRAAKAEQSRLRTLRGHLEEMCKVVSVLLVHTSSQTDHAAAKSREMEVDMHRRACRLQSLRSNALAAALPEDREAERLIHVAAERARVHMCNLRKTRGHVWARQNFLSTLLAVAHRMCGGLDEQWERAGAELERLEERLDEAVGLLRQIEVYRPEGS